MAQGGATNPTYSDQFIENIVKYIEGKPDLMGKLKELLKDNEDFKKIVEKSEDVPGKDIVELLKGNENLSKGAIDIVGKYLEQDRTSLAEFFEQANKVEGMEAKLETLGDRLLIQGVIGGAALTTLTGALAGTLAIGGVAGALITGGAALAGFLAILAIAAIACVVYQQRGKIKEGSESLGKAIKSFVKDLIDKLPTVQARENNFSRLHKELSKSIIDASGLEKEDEVKSKAKVIEMLQDKDQQSAIMKLIEDKTIAFSKEGENGMDRLIEKGLSTHKADKDALKKLMDDFLPKIMATGENDIKR